MAENDEAEFLGVKLPQEAIDAALGKFRADRSFVLSSGKNVAARKATGQDVLNAQTTLAIENVRGARYGGAILIALIAEIVQIDGDVPTYRELLAGSALDLIELQNELAPALIPSTTPAPAEVQTAAATNGAADRSES